MSAAPGWYPDEDDPALARYWDGSAWTGQTRPQAEVTSGGSGWLTRHPDVWKVGLGVLAGAAVVIAAVLVFGGDDGDPGDTEQSATATTIVTTTTAAGEPMTVERMLNVELPDLTADGGFPDAQLVDGAATAGEEGATLNTDASRVVIADLTGDGVDDGLVLVSYDPFGDGNGLPPTDTYLYDSSGAFLDAVHNAEMLGTFDVPAVEGDTLTFQVLSLGPGEPRCCPTVETIARWRWNGTEFAPA